MRNILVASLWLMLCSGWCLAQAPGDTSSPEKTRPSHPADLMARSEMQAPRSIPITRRLRFEEIPVDVPAQITLQDNQPSIAIQQNNLPERPEGSAVPNPEMKSRGAVKLTEAPITPQPSVEAIGSTGNPPQR